MIKFSSVVHQADDREVRPLEQNQVDSACAVNKARMGDYPRPEEDVTPEQLAALRALFSSGAPPYVDLAVWEPYGRRIQRKLRFSGQVLVAQGILHTVQLYGPPTVCEWQACWAIFLKKNKKTVQLCFRSSRRPRLTCARRWLPIMPLDTGRRRGP